MNALEPYLGVIKAVVILAILLACFAAGHHYGAKAVQQKWDAEHAALAEATLDRERETRRAVDTITMNALKEKDRAKTTIDSLRADVRSGAERLSVAVSSCPATSAGAEHQQARAELLPEVADRIVGIAADADDTVRELNTCIDKYNAVTQAHE